jgi:LuxR family maltose regulon positive regulatory protein
MLLLQSKAGFGAGPGKATDFAEPNRHLFAYLAQEVLNELPEDLQDFMLRSSILIELNPSLCTTLTGRADSAAVLDALYRRNLFLTAIDEFVPILRFHDLFRDFLEAELARRNPALKRQLHEQAASVETVASRAIYHLLVAEKWDEAMKRIAQAGDERLAHGAIATVERWIDTIPSEVRATNPMIAYLRGSTQTAPTCPHCQPSGISPQPWTNSYCRSPTSMINGSTSLSRGFYYSVARNGGEVRFTAGTK